MTHGWSHYANQNPGQETYKEKDVVEKDDEKREPDPIRLKAFRELPPDVVKSLSKSEVKAFLSDEEWPDSLRDKLDKHKDITKALEIFRSTLENTKTQSLTEKPLPTKKKKPTTRKKRKTRKRR